MKGGIPIIRKRVDITLPGETLELIDRVTEHGARSRFIDAAVRHFIQVTGRADLRKQLKLGAIQRADRDLQLTEEQFTPDEEVWHGGRREFGRNVARSTSSPLILRSVRRSKRRAPY